MRAEIGFALFAVCVISVVRVVLHGEKLDRRGDSHPRVPRFGLLYLARADTVSAFGQIKYHGLSKKRFKIVRPFG